MIQVGGSVSGTALDVDPTLKAAKVANRPPEADGFYFHSSRSGALAGATAASIAWALRWTHATKLLVVDLIRIRATIATPFTTAQMWGFEGVVARGFTAALAAGGTTFLPSADGGHAFKKRTNYTTSNVTEIRMAAAAALTGGTLTPDTSHFVNHFTWELAAAATVPRSSVFCEKDYGDGSSGPIILATNEGLLVRPTHTLGAAGVVTLSVEVAWHEVDPAKL
jgi:hypothetical protein